MATKRLPGNFETSMEFTNINIGYHGAKILFNCSLDCRMTLEGKRLAKHDHCFLKFVMFKGNVSIREEDCVNRFRSHLRNGTIQKHEYKIKEPGFYTFKLVVHFVSLLCY